MGFGCPLPLGNLIYRQCRNKQPISGNYYSAERLPSPPTTNFTPHPAPASSASREVSETHDRNVSVTTQVSADSAAGRQGSGVANPYLSQVGSALIPRQVPCQLTLKYNGRTQEIFNDYLPWNDSFKQKFAQFNKIALQSLQQHHEPQSKSIYRRLGRCHLIRDQDGCIYASKILENEQQWSEVLPFLVTSFCPNHPHEKFRLKIIWEYSDLDVPSVPGERYRVTIKKHLHSKRLKNWQNKTFIPRKDVDEILRDSTIRELVKSDKSLSSLASQGTNDSYPYDEETFIDDVTNGASRLLGLCIYEDLPLACLYHLMKPNREGSSTGFRDVDLPLKEEDCPDQAHKVEFSKLVERQGGFKAHVFERPGPEGTHTRPRNYTLTDDVVIPITFDEKTDRLGYGGFGEVFKVYINPDHHSFGSVSLPSLKVWRASSVAKTGVQDKTLPFALKRFFQQGDRTEADYINETRMLSTLAVFRHPHITPHLASWTQSNTMYMLFPCAIENLYWLLRNRKPPEPKNDFVLWLLGQLKGIADGLRLIHNLAPAGLGNQRLIPNPTTNDERKRTGYHHDIKPENILVFADDNVGDREPQFSQLRLQISDFGAARIHNVLSRSGMKKVSHKTPNLTAGDEQYGAPDFALHAETSRPYDLWSLGCVFMEVLLWAFQTSGSDLDEFALERLSDPETLGCRSAAFWHQNIRGNIALKTSVRNRLHQLREYSKKRPVLKYIVDTTEKLLTLPPAERPDAPQICKDIDAALLQAAIDTEHEDFSIDQTKETLQFAAPPAAYDHRSRPSSIDERSIHGPDDTHLEL